MFLDVPVRAFNSLKHAGVRHRIPHPLISFTLFAYSLTPYSISISISNLRYLSLTLFCDPPSPRSHTRIVWYSVFPLSSYAISLEAVQASSSPSFRHLREFRKSQASWWRTLVEHLSSESIYKRPETCLGPWISSLLKLPSPP